MDAIQLCIEHDSFISNFPLGSYTCKKRMQSFGNGDLRACGSCMREQLNASIKDNVHKPIWALHKFIN